jgi:hypothetical protein
MNCRIKVHTRQEHFHRITAAAAAVYIPEQAKKLKCRKFLFGTSKAVNWKKAVDIFNSNTM